MSRGQLEKRVVDEDQCALGKEEVGKRVPIPETQGSYMVSGKTKGDVF